MKRQQRIEALSFELNIEGKPLEVTAKPYMAANQQPRFRVSYNGSPVHIFGYNEDLKKVIVMDSASADIHPKIENAIGQALTHKLAA
ncbi:hypothetical protein [Flavihumibacter solisilvae]|uniref:Uncharacterized protein n=1 Tax=Flavihumibacter solisilvae TaxID=1349421 RepID=A0A0C1L815_9BACT|nr:hypothetical protein [Flavihumibacter solisilvae]KIC96307.1 hypothetical protein OI18_00660 [Flavihumibacter solisilvae]